MPRHYCPPAYIPTPDEIERACREIRAGWTDLEYRRRYVGSETPRVSVRIVRLRDVAHLDPELFEDCL